MSAQAKVTATALSILLAGGAGLFMAPLGWPLAVLGGLAYSAGAMLWPLGALGGVVASLPFYLFARQLGGQAVSPSEATLLLAALGIGARAIWGRRRPSEDGGTQSSAGVPFVVPSQVKRAASRARTNDAGPRDAMHPDWSTRGTWRRFDAPVALFLAAALLSLLATEYLRLSLRELRTLIVEPVLFFVLLRAVLRTPNDARQLVDVLTVAATVVATIAVIQVFVGGAVTDVQGVRRVHGTYTSPNHLALLLGRAIPFLLAAAWLLPQARPIRLGALVLCGLALLLTFSLGGWIGTGAAVLIVVGLLGGRRPLALLLLAGALAVAAMFALAPPERLANRLDPTQGTTLVRVQLWQASLALIGERPLLGIGLDNFLYRYSPHVPPGGGMEPNLSHPHNLVLQFWLQLGILGVIALGWLLVRFVRATLLHVGPAAPPPARTLAVGALASMADFVVHGAIDNSYFLPDLAMVFWLTVAAACTLTAVAPGGDGRERPDPARPSGVQSATAAPT